MAWAEELQQRAHVRVGRGAGRRQPRAGRHVGTVPRACWAEAGRAEAKRAVIDRAVMESLEKRANLSQTGSQKQYDPLRFRNYECVGRGAFVARRLPARCTGQRRLAPHRRDVVTSDSRRRRLTPATDPEAVLLTHGPVVRLCRPTPQAKSHRRTATNTLRDCSCTVFRALTDHTFLSPFTKESCVWTRLRILDSFCQKSSKMQSVDLACTCTCACAYMPR